MTTTMTTATTATERQAVSLCDWANDHSEQGPVLFWTSFGQQLRQHCLLCHQYDTTAEERGWLDMKGTVSEDGSEWDWDGRGNPTDFRQNTVYRLTAFISSEKWDEMNSEYESD